LDTKLNDNKESIEDVNRNKNESLNKIDDLKVKSKRSKKIYSINLIGIIMAVIIAISMSSLYPKIKEIATVKNTVSPFTYNEFTHNLSQYTYVLYNEAAEAKQGKKINPSDIYLISKSNAENENIEYYNFLIENINAYLSSWKQERKIDFQNLDYTILDKDGTIIKANNQKNLSQLIESNNTKELTDKYLFYMTLNFDENGQINLINSYGADENHLRDLLPKFKLTDAIRNENKYEGYLIDNPIKNVTFIYGVNKELKYSDRISDIVQSSERHSYENISYIYVLILSAIIIILSLLTPFKLEKEVALCKVFFKIPLEFIIIIAGTLIGGMFAASSLVIFYTLNGDFVNKVLTQIGFDTSTAGILVDLFNIIYWFIYCIVIFAVIVSIKNIFNIGIMEYLKEKLFTVKIFKISKNILSRILKLLCKIIFSVINPIKKAIKSIGNIDLSDKTNKVIIKVLGINCIIISIFCFVWFFGIILAIVYTIILFVVFRKYLMDIKNKFEILLSATNKIAAGNLDIVIEENLGVFNPIKEQLMEIQSGFKKAVNEEVKSQRMKTELISNVSHDLKTPLTSIITYVDLLKGENLAEEERKAYIDTLDKKSQRLKFLIEDLFEVSRATSGNINLNLVKVDIVELMRQTEVELDDKIKNANLKIRNNFPGNKSILQLDSQKTFRIFENLLNNVVKYAMEGSRVYIDIIANEDNVEITIKNMSAEEINFEAEDIVERFERGDKSRNTEGSGLGLAIVKSFVEVQGGTFNVDVDGDLFKVTIVFKN
jgi:signal transduction histidine kinase